MAALLGRTLSGMGDPLMAQKACWLGRCRQEEGQA